MLASISWCQEASNRLHVLVIHGQRAGHQVRSRLEHRQLHQEDGDGERGGVEVWGVQHQDQGQDHGLVHEDQPQRGGEDLQGICVSFSLQRWSL